MSQANKPHEFAPNTLAESAKVNANFDEIYGKYNTLDTNAVTTSGDQTVAGTKTFSSPVTSNVATGTAPLSVASTTKVANLNADSVGGYKIWKGTQTAYDALSPNYDANTVYYVE
jgi:hypothetical protein